MFIFVFFIFAYFFYSYTENISLPLSTCYLLIKNYCLSIDKNLKNSFFPNTVLAFSIDMIKNV